MECHRQTAQSRSAGSTWDSDPEGIAIRAARAHTDEIGCVLEADIYRPDFDFTGVERLKHRPDEELLLRALVQTFLDHSHCIYIQLKSGNSYLRARKSDGSEIFDVSNDRHLEYWINQPVDVYLVIRQTDELSGQQVIRWMNVTRYLKTRKDTKNRQIIFDGEKLDMEAVWKVRDAFFPTVARQR